MSKLNPIMAQRIAEAASAFEEKRTGHLPKSVTVVMGDNTLVITLHEVLPPAERALARNTAGSAKVQELHRRLFADSAAPFRQEINRITGMDVREAVVEVEPSTGTVVQAFTTGTVVQVFLLARSIPGQTWIGARREPSCLSPSARDNAS
jgi:uncharacterized protein YbcI